MFWVALVSQPIADPAVKDPIWPMLLINAIVPAEAVPARKRVGMVQKIAMHAR
ncbi:hypothetical protein D3C76_1778050 [compost metagenome]